MKETLIKKELELRLLEDFVKVLDNEGLDWHYMDLFGGEQDIEPDKEKLLVYLNEYKSRESRPPIEGI